MRIYVMTDMEGCAGILNHDEWVLPSGRWYELGREFLTREVNAAVEGFLAGGATGVMVVDGHGAGGIDPFLLNPAAELAAGGAPQPPYPFFLDASFAGIAWVGQHAKAGTPNSHITHTQWFDWLDMTINGVSVGEYGEMALVAQELGVPAFFAAGEDALCREAEALTPDVVTVGVKRGVNPDGLDHLTGDEYRRAKLAAIHLSPEEARRRIRAGAERAVRKLRRSRRAFHGPKLEPPYVLERRMRRGASQPPLVQRIEHATSIIAALNSPWRDA